MVLIPFQYHRERNTAQYRANRKRKIGLGTRHLQA